MIIQNLIVICGTNVCVAGYYFTFSEWVRAVCGMRLLSVGHSDRSTEEFLGILRRYAIDGLIDVRTTPASGRFPHFNKRNLQRWCKENGIEYVWMGRVLGGEGIEENLATNVVQKGLQEIVELIQRNRHQVYALFCSEADWRRCHRALLAVELEKLNVSVEHC